MWDIWQEIYGTLKRNKLRTALTGFAVAWGIFMLIVLLGASNGLIHAFEGQSEGLALNSIKLYSGYTSMPYDGLERGRRISFDNGDVDALKSELGNHVDGACGVVHQEDAMASYGTEYMQIDLNGVAPEYVGLERIKTTSGRFINDIDIKERRKVVVLSDKDVEVLFKGSNHEPIGRFITIGGIAYQVIGTYKDSDDSNLRDAYMPFTTLQTVYGKMDRLHNITVTIKDISTKEESENLDGELRRVLAARHRFDKTDGNAVWIWNRFSQYLDTLSAAAVLHTAMWVIGIFTLLSGVVGVSNIMLITVKERTHEFGIRKALGAKPRSILWLVVAESVFITTLFGYIGMVAGVGATEWMDFYLGSQTVDFGSGNGATFFANPTVDISIAIEATITLIVAGTLAGFIPAYKAARIRPIEALNAN